ncbi:HAD family hydrolase, partial [Pseudomonas sp. FW305-BF6]|uniref:HAD-IA family hydrolase n=1 Tax=Pseudomonas sp. FW305-BF6 TaxID=2070673 RepID=UPI000CC3A16E
VLFSYIEENCSIPFDRESLESKVSGVVQVKLGDPVLRESVEDYLIAAKQAGLKIGLASSSSRAWVEGFLKQMNIYDYFEVIKTKEDVSDVKPDPELYMKAIEALGIE